MARKQFTICLDFDGTFVYHEFPEVGAVIPGAADWVRRWIEAGARIILWTIRDNDHATGKKYLQEAIDTLMQNGIELFAVNNNPSQIEWSRSPKAYCNMYVDDAAFGAPLRRDEAICSRAFLDWDIVGPEVLTIIEEYYR
jgi:ribonucleotide monophosphatase NagD (HAD superfamily)